MLKVKICGVTRVEDALMVAEAGADAIGLNFCPRSPRRITVDVAAAIAAALPAGVCRVGVFVDAPRDEILALARQIGLNAIQFHGDENAAYCSAGWGCKTIKAIRVRDAAALVRAAAYPVDFILADAYVEGEPGGTGQRVPREWLTGLRADRLIVAGGLNAENVADVVRWTRPAAVDVASGVERAPGIKDPEKVRRFVSHAKSA
jgi:phosphoribosylanthranilate isomerase